MLGMRIYDLCTLGLTYSMGPGGGGGGGQGGGTSPPTVMYVDALIKGVDRDSDDQLTELSNYQWTSTCPILPHVTCGLLVQEEYQGLPQA